MIFAIDGFSFLKAINEQNNLCIPKYGSQNLACWCLHLWSLWTVFTYCCPLSWQPIWLHSEVVDPCFIHYWIFTQKFLFVVLKQLQTESSTCCCFWLTVSKRSTHFAHGFLIDKCSCKIVNALLSDIFNFSALSRNFNLRMAKTSLWSFLVFSGTTG